jgi:uncharacterized protein YlbG (UPF0298 family)
MIVVDYLQKVVGMRHVTFFGAVWFQSRNARYIYSTSLHLCCNAADYPLSF